MEKNDKNSFFANFPDFFTQVDNKPKLAETLLVEFLLKYVEQQPVGMFINDANSQQTLWMNQTAADIVGFGKHRRRHISYELGLQYCHPDDVQVLQKAMNKLLTSDEVVESLIQVQHENGEWKWLQIYVKVMQRNADGTPHLISGTLIDMTDPLTLEPRLKDVLSENQIRRQQHSACKLSKREKEVMQHIVKGLTDNEVADVMFLAFETIRTHRKNIYRKLKIKNTAALVIFAKENYFF